MISHKLLNGLTLFTKHIPFINSIICIFYTIIEFLHIHIHIIQFISCLSLFYIFVLYILSYLLHFCWKHRLAIHFLSTYWLLSLIDSFITFCRISLNCSFGMKFFHSFPSSVCMLYADFVSRIFIASEYFFAISIYCFKWCDSIINLKCSRILAS